MRLNSAVALDAKSKWRKGDREFWSGAIGSGPELEIRPNDARTLLLPELLPLPLPKALLLSGACLGTLLLNEGCVWTRPCVAEKNWVSEIGDSDGPTVTCDCHHDADVDWSLGAAAAAGMGAAPEMERNLNVQNELVVLLKKLCRMRTIKNFLVVSRTHYTSFLSIKIEFERINIMSSQSASNH